MPGVHFASMRCGFHALSPMLLLLLAVQVGKAFLTLFVTATLDGYTRTMYATMASR